MFILHDEMVIAVESIDHAQTNVNLWKIELADRKRYLNRLIRTALSLDPALTKVEVLSVLYPPEIHDENQPHQDDAPQDDAP